MTAEQWQRIKSLLAEAMRLPAEQRAEFPDGACADDPVVHGELVRMMQQPETTDTFIKPIVNFGLPEQTFQPGELILGRFRILRFIGRGGMGEVYEAEDLRLGRVALKTIRPDLAANRQHLLRFEHEVQLARKVTHPNVCRIYELFVTPGESTHFLTMELLEGETLAARIERDGALPFPEAELIAGQLCSALQAIHDAGIIHRDFKSNNVMLVSMASATHAVVMDLGLAREAKPADGSASLTLSGAVMGTPEYMAPEQFRAGAVTDTADIYALGVVLYEIATGSRPFHAKTPLEAAILRARKPDAASSIRPEIPPQWDQVIRRCLEFEPAARFHSAREVAVALSTPPAKASRILGRRPILVAAFGLLMLLAVVGGVWEFVRNIRKPAMIEQRIAVLEFENIGGDTANRAFCEGLMQALSSKLSELERFQGSLSVVPASDVRKDKVTSAREARRDFGVTIVITGSVQRGPSGNRLTINIVDAQALKQLRSQEFFVPATDTVAMQQGVITQVTNLLDIQLRPEAQRLLAEGNTPVPGAYDYYLQGEGYLLRGRSFSDQAVAEFKHALETDPNYALAYAGLAEAYWNRYMATNDTQWIDSAWRQCRKAIELAPRLAAARVTLALLSSSTGHYEYAIREAHQALEIDPRDDRAYAELARALEATNQTSDAEQTLKKAIALRPGYWNNYVRLGIFYGEHGRYLEAIVPFTRVTELVPDNPAGYTDLGIVYHALNRDAEAIEMLNKSIRVRPSALAYSTLASIYFFQHRYTDALPVFEKAVAGGTKDYNIWGNLGDAYRWTGNAEKAASAYQKAIELAGDRMAVNPRDPKALSGLALYRAKIGQSAEARRSMDKALILAPGDKQTLFNAAIVCEIIGDRHRALEYLRKAISGGYSVSDVAAEPELGKLREDPLYKIVVSPNGGH